MSGNREAEPSSNLIDFSADLPRSASDNSLRQTRDTLRPSSSFHEELLSSKVVFGAEEYIRKPRVYDRNEFVRGVVEKNEDKPPPLPPKRRSQSRKNIKLTNRLRSAGVDVSRDEIERPNSVLGHETPSAPLSRPILSTGLSFDNQIFDSFSFSNSSSDALALWEENAENNPTQEPARRCSYSDKLQFLAKKNYVENVNILKKSQSFESRLKSALSQSNVDLIKQNLVEFEVSSKPPEKLFPADESFSSTNRVPSWENLFKDPSRISATSLSVEELEEFLNAKDARSSVNEVKTDEHEMPAAVSSQTIENVSSSEFPKSHKKHATLPPPRPPPPKSFQRFSLPVELNSSDKADSSLYFGDGIFDLTEERNEEAIAFCNSVAELRKIYKFNDEATNPGFISNPFTSLKASPQEGSANLQVHVYLEQSSSARIIECNMFSKVDEVALTALVLFQKTYNDIDTISKNMYIFKVCGESSYLEGNQVFIYYEYIQNCVKLDKDIKLVLMQRCKIPRELQRTEADDKEEAGGMYFKHFFQLKSSTSISRQGLSVLIETYNSEIAKLISNATKTENAVYVPEKIIQIVKALCLSLAYVETTQMHDAIKLLLSLKPKSKENLVRNHPESAVVDFNKIIDPGTFDKGRFNIALEKLTSSVFSLVDAYCKAFDTDFTIRNPRVNIKNSPRKQSVSTERISSASMDDKFGLRVSSVHRIPQDWKLKYDYFEIECGLYYGGQSLCQPVLTKLSKPIKGLFEHIRWDEVLQFNIKIKEIPRETRLCLALHGLSSARKQTSESKNKTELGWIGVNLFDFKGLLISGCHLFGLISGIDVNTASTCSNNIQEPTSVVLKTDFQVYHTEVIFLDSLVQPSSCSANLACFSEMSLKLEGIFTRGLCKDITKKEKEMLWENRLDLRNIPRALSFVLMSIPEFKAETLSEVQDLLNIWSPLSPRIAMELLKAGFPDIFVREHAVKYLSSIKENELCDYLPQLVQGLKYESYHKSALAMFLIKSALKSPRVAHYLFWHLKYYIADAQFSQRFQIVLGGILSVCGSAMRDQLSREDQMIQLLAQTAKKIKDAKESFRRNVLCEELEVTATEIDGCLRLPVDPAIEIKSINIQDCSYFNSFTVPLSLDFSNSDPRGQSVKFMFKIGDDLRQDLITLQLFRVMNRLWLSEGINLKMITYHCMPTSPMAGMIELIKEAFTLREIHVQYGVTGSFKDDVIGLWLQKFNQSQEYKKAVDNFSASCAACCVASYILGIGDRHNDNIMVTKKGHMFHIDFSKILGNAQKFGTIRRDRVPFVLTPDMAYVINSGDTMSHNFQHFVELCCQGFNVIRRNGDLILNLLCLMVSSGITYLSTPQDLEYVQHALQLQLSESEATVYFTRLIETSLSSKSTQLNFFIHNMAHLKDSNALSATASILFSFSNKVYSRESDGEITSVRCVDIQKRYIPEKHYIFVLNLLRSNKSEPCFIFRKYEEFQELQTKLSHVFGNTSLPALPGRIIVGRSEIQEVARKRRHELDEYLVALMKLEEVSSSEVFYTFLHSYMRDEQDSARFSEILFKLEQGMPKNRVGGEIKLSYQYRNGSFDILVMHARSLVSRTVQGLADPYVKSYLLPDPKKLTKRKTRVAKRNLNPTFNQTLKYEIPLEDLQQKVLQVTVWDYDAVRVNEYLGGVNCYMSTHDLTKETTRWYELKDLGQGM